MPLPMMAGDASTMLAQPGMQAPPPAPPAMDPAQSAAPPSPASATPQPTDPRQQARGAVELVSQAKTAFATQMEGLARQFPGAAKSANQVVMLLDRALQDVVRDILVTLQAPEPEAPSILR